MKRKPRYLNKIESLEKELEFLKSHKLKEGEAIRRAIFYSLQVCVEILMDIAAMKLRDIGLVVEDNYTNLEKLKEEGIINQEEEELLRQYNGLRNVIVHRYNKIKIEIIKEAVEKIGRLKEIGLKIIES